MALPVQNNGLTGATKPLTGDVGNPLAAAQGDQEVVSAQKAVTDAQANVDKFEADKSGKADKGGGKKKGKKAKKAEKKAEQKADAKKTELTNKLQEARTKETSALNNQATRADTNTTNALNGLNKQHADLAGQGQFAQNYLNDRFGGGGAAQATVPQSQLVGAGPRPANTLNFGPSGLDTAPLKSSLLGGPTAPSYTAPPFTYARPTITAPPVTYARPLIQTPTVTNSLSGTGAGVPRTLTLASGGGGANVDPGGAYTAALRAMTTPTANLLGTGTGAAAGDLLTRQSGGGGANVDPGGAAFRAYTPILA